jgi:uncharacterized repeat protein (TIGR03803 family)
LAAVSARFREAHSFSGNPRLAGDTKSPAGFNLMRHAVTLFLVLAPISLLLIPGSFANAQTESVIYSFTGGTDDGAVPANGLAFHNGSIFGVTNEGGGYNEDGILFQLSPGGNGGWNEQAIHVFEGGNDGASPSPVIFDARGNLYGEATSFGEYGCGLVFEFSPNGSGWGEIKVLYNFTCAYDGGSPEGGLTLDAAGNLYGTTGKGGDVNLCQSDPWNVGCGVVFKLTPGAKGIWAESVLYTFTGQRDGYAPEGGLVLDSTGNLYGATEYYGYNNANGGWGLIFELSPQPQGEWKYSVLHRFPAGAGGQLPFSNLVVLNGNVYGTTWNGGLMSACNGNGCGIAYEVSVASKQFKILHTFTGAADGGNLFSPLTLAKGKLYGTTQIGGDLNLCQGTGGSRGDGCGVVYELSPAGNLQVVYTFENSNNNDGDGPDGRMTSDSSGNLYGETRIGGTDGLGSVFEVPF